MVMIFGALLLELNDSNLSLAEYIGKKGLAVTTSGTATSFLARYFYFLITLDNAEQIIPVPVRVYVNT